MEWILSAMLIAAVLCLSEGDVCLRKYNKNTGICEGVMREKYTNFTACCSRHNAAGFGQDSWRRGHNRFLCIPCAAKQPQSFDEGHWSNWSEWGPCSVTCGRGIQLRFRQCTQNRKCPGFSSGQKTCHLKNCPVHGGWSNWGPYSSCSVSCGTGEKVRQRLCNNPKPQHNGNDCDGSSLEVSTCHMGHCPINGGWSKWTEWSACSITCGSGLQQRFRDCNSPMPQYNGKPCKGESQDYKDCIHPKACPVNGGWSKWSEFGPCKATECVFEKGVQIRTRACTNPHPVNGGKMCQGSYYEAQNCKNPINCKRFTVDMKMEGSGSGCRQSYFGSGFGGSGDDNLIDCDQENDEALLDENLIVDH